MLVRALSLPPWALGMCHWPWRHTAGPPRCRPRAAGSASASESRSPLNLPAAMSAEQACRSALVVHHSTRNIHFKFKLASIGVTVGPSLTSVTHTQRVADFTDKVNRIGPDQLLCTHPLKRACSFACILTLLSGAPCVASSASVGPSCPSWLT